ncbi:hypothetical protein VNO78_18897 [Psophocarpus tetragonolobus]|uniref:Uncharacterized protein n=1 Tax=Psophocarpus tetragonolobus TaxID=3891 RepID=A0AAN9S897_PSOTE
MRCNEHNELMFDSNFEKKYLIDSAFIVKKDNGCNSAKKEANQDTTVQKSSYVLVMDPNSSNEVQSMEEGWICRAFVMGLGLSRQDLIDVQAARGKRDQYNKSVGTGYVGGGQFAGDNMPLESRLRLGGRSQKHSILAVAYLGFVGRGGIGGFQGAWRWVWVKTR